MEIPGYIIEHMLGQGGMGTVHLARDEKHDKRRVALKVMSPALMFDREFPNRLQQAIKNAAKLKHRAIVRIHDAGIHRNNIYIVSEYISGGALSQRIEAQNIDVFEALEIIRHMADALDYSHGQGVIHGDVRPPNILFRADGSAVLTDFEISRSVVSASERRAAGTLGTSHGYASPEEYAGQEIDERSDLYALGVTLYEMLTGMLPYEGETKDKVGVHHRRRDIPRLPEDLKLLQPMINDLLVTEPDERIGSARALLDILDELETDGIPGRVVRERQEAEMEAHAKRRASDSGARSQEIDAEALERRRRFRRNFLWGGALAASVMLSVGGYFFWEWYRIESNPQLKVDGLLLQARKLAEQQSDVGGLVGVYREVLEISPEHPFARSKLDELAERFEQQVLDIMTEGDFDSAEQLARDSGKYFGPDDMVGRLNKRLVEFLRLVAILDEAGQLLEQGAVIRPEGTNAYEYYRTVAERDPSSDRALAGLRFVAERMGERAVRALDQGDFHSAARFLTLGYQSSPDHAELKRVEQIIRGHDQDGTILRDVRLARAEGYFNWGKDELAQGQYEAAISEDPENEAAKAGLAALTKFVREPFSLERNKAFFDALQSSTAEHDRLNQLRKEIMAERRQLSRTSRQLVRAQTLMAKGYLTKPPGGNAIEIFEAILADDPGNGAARAALAAIAQRLVDAAEDADRYGMRQDAIRYYELAIALVPAQSDWEVRLIEIKGATVPAGRPGGGATAATPRRATDNASRATRPATGDGPPAISFN